MVHCVLNQQAVYCADRSSWLDQMKDQGGRLTRWSLTLQSYQFTVVHRKGRANANADALSCAAPGSSFAHDKKGGMWPSLHSRIKNSLVLDSTQLERPDKIMAGDPSSSLLEIAQQLEDQSNSLHLDDVMQQLPRLLKESLKGGHCSHRASHQSSSAPSPTLY